jgi:hypothetical protein
LNCFALCLPALALIVCPLGADRASACELCRRYGVSAFHVEGSQMDRTIGGDAFNDALAEPPKPDGDEQGGSGSFVVQGGKWPQPGGPGSPITLTYSFQNMFDGGLLMPNGQPLPNDLIRRSIEEALRLWASVVPVHYVEVPDNGLGYGFPGAQYGQIRFRHVFINGPDPPPPRDPIAKAQAYFPISGANYAGDVEFDHGDRWQEVGTRPVPDILGATIHEIGHTLGLGHTSNSQANMYWIFTRYSGLGTGKLHPDDIAGIQSVYGAGVGSVTSLVPEPTAGLFVVGGAMGWAALVKCRRRRG